MTGHWTCIYTGDPECLHLWLHDDLVTVRTCKKCDAKEVWVPNKTPETPGEER